MSLSVTFIWGFYCFFAIQVDEIFQVFRVCFLMSFFCYQLMSGRVEWFYWISGFLWWFFTIGLFRGTGENLRCGDWEAQNLRSEILCSFSETLKIFSVCHKIPSKTPTKPIYYKNLIFRPIFMFQFQKPNIFLSSSVFMKIELMCLAMSRYFGIRSIKIKLRFTFWNNSSICFLGLFKVRNFKNFDLVFAGNFHDFDRF